MESYFSKILILFLLVSFLIPYTVEGIKIENPLKVKNFWELLGKIIDFLFYISLAIVPMVIIIAGYYFITAAGEPEKINTAKKIILWALIGFLVIMCAKGLINLLAEIFEVEEPFSFLKY